MKKKNKTFIISLAITLIVVGLLGFAFNLSSMKKNAEEITESYSTKNTDTLILNIAHYETKIHYTNDPEVKIKLSGTDMKLMNIKPSYTNRRMNLTIGQNKNHFSIDNNFKIDLFFLSFSMQPQATLDVYLPKSIKNIEINAQDAAIYSEQLPTLKKMKIINDYGDIALSSLAVETITIKNASGNVALTNITAKNSYFDITSGDLDLFKLSGTIKAKTDSGDIHLSNGTLDRPLTLTTTFGDIDINLSEQPKNTRIKAQTSDGDIIMGNKENVTQQDFGDKSNKWLLKTNRGNISVSYDRDSDKNS